MTRITVAGRVVVLAMLLILGWVAGVSLAALNDPPAKNQYPFVSKDVGDPDAPLDHLVAAEFEGDPQLG